MYHTALIATYQPHFREGFLLLLDILQVNRSTK